MFVIKTIARDMGRDVYVGPTVSGIVTLKLEKISPEEALKRVLATQPLKLDYRFVGSNTLVVAAPEKLAETESNLLSPGAPPPAQEQIHTTRADLAAGANPLAMPPGAGILRRPSPAKVNGDFNTESYDRTSETGFREVSKEPLSTFSIDVDTASLQQRAPLPQ